MDPAMQDRCFQNTLINCIIEDGDAVQLSSLLRNNDSEWASSLRLDKKIWKIWNKKHGISSRFVKFDLNLFQTIAFRGYRHISKFRLYIPPLYLREHKISVNLIIASILRREVKELIVETDGDVLYRMPYSFADIGSGLIYLSLSRCSFITGCNFLRLLSLQLEDVFFNPKPNRRFGFSAPLLKNLVLNNCDGIADVDFYLPEVESLDILGTAHDVKKIIGNILKLKQATIGLSLQLPVWPAHLGHLAKVEELTLDGNFLKHLIDPSEFHISNPVLKTLELNLLRRFHLQELSLQDMDQKKAALALLRVSPNLESMSISIKQEDDSIRKLYFVKPSMMQQELLSLYIQGMYPGLNRGNQQIVTEQSSSLTPSRHNKTGHSGLTNVGTLTVHAEETVGSKNAVEMAFHCSNLENKDLISRSSDPMAVVYEKKRDGTLEEIGRTEVIMDPAWIGKINVSYQFEIVQPLIFRVYDVDTKYHNLPVKMLKLEEQEFLGEASCVVSEILTKQSRSLTLRLHNKNRRSSLKNLGTLTVHAEETAGSRNAVEMTFHCSNLDNKDLFSKCDPFLSVSRIVETGITVPIYKTEVVNNNLNPIRKPLCLTIQQFGSKDNPLVIECFDFNSSGNHVLIGKMQKSVKDLEKLHKEKIGANFIIPSARQGHEKVLKGQLFVYGFLEKELHSFIDYISSGFQLNFMVAVDFTASNGNPRSVSSLHYIDPSGQLNDYQQAITEVGEVIQFYDSNRRFAAWGFGGRTFDGSVSHCFNLSSTGGFEVEGVEGILSAYLSALHNVALAGPTLFGPVINKAAEIAGHSFSYNKSKYFVLLIITDGVLTDLQETKDALVRASNLPLSILIVGVGGADFEKMEILDADGRQRLESSTRRIATRDIVQFVPMRDVHGGQISVVQALLKELPGQFLTYMRSRCIKPE
ncbi:protein BONZAI 3-like isoform X2 [Cornus florida]|uniref:protein BONZAI 3-like isoform X2 n=1 Tax=Cornus florida TaxID=4283 RepID=UPI002898AB66|nr:protein BONZAI 3-like isoform X2 [Cornus florida]